MTNYTQRDDILNGGKVIDLCKEVLADLSFRPKLHQVNDLFNGEIGAFSFNDRVMMLAKLSLRMGRDMGKLSTIGFNHLADIQAKLIVSLKHRSW